MSRVTEQKGFSSSTPSFVRRWLQSKVMTALSSEEHLAKQRSKAEKKRKHEKRPHVVEYFHQLDDGYSHLAMQTLAPLLARYNIELKVHLVTAGADSNNPEPEMLKQLSLSDAAQIAPRYGLTFPQRGKPPSHETCDLAVRILCRFSPAQICQFGPIISDAVISNNPEQVQALSVQHGLAAQNEAAAALAAGNRRREQLGHYSGAMFWYEGEWYWGVDRLYHLERRLASLNAVKNPKLQEVAPRPEIKNVFTAKARDLTLEYYPSLRSPYTAVSWAPTLKLAQDSGVKLDVKPVLPMVMRGVPATRQKGVYILKDAAREARAAGVEYGRFYDPIGKPVMHGYSLYMWAKTFGKGEDVLGAFLNIAFVKGWSTNSTKGLKKVVELAGLDWSQAKQHLADTSWEQTLEANRTRMYGAGCWGVPSYRLLDKDGGEILGVWGQDRLWLVSQMIAEKS